MGYFSLPMQFRKWSQTKRLAIVEACLIGLVAAFSAILLKYGISWLGGWRIQAANTFPAWLALPTIGLLGGWLSGWLVDRLSPGAAGSGIPRIKAALNYIPIALDWRVALTKLVTTIITLASGFALGRQGPTVHLGAALAAQLSQWFPTSPGYRRQLIAAGAAAGLAAGFNAPIAGVLFVIEELLQDVSEMTLGTAILASFVGAMVSRLWGANELTYRLSEVESSFQAQEIPLFILLGLLAGAFGGLFSRGVLASLQWNRKLALGLPWRMAIAGMVSGLILGFLPELYRNFAGLNSLVVHASITWELTASVFAVQFLLTLIAAGSGAPGGLFAPSLTLGASLGLLVCYGAESWQEFLGVPIAARILITAPTTYALAGMGAFFSAVARGPITAIVIVFEMTTDFNLVLPLMIVSGIAYLSAEQISKGSLYSHLLEMSGIHLNKKAALDHQLADLTAAAIMQRQVETLESHRTLKEILKVFVHSHHRGFPVMEDGKLVGIISQSDLSKPANRSLPLATPLSTIMTPQPVTVAPNDSLSHVLHLLNHYQISRLPVTEGRRLVGIITRADIIRAESEQMAKVTGQMASQAAPSYVVYQTRDLAIGQGRLLIPLSNPETAEALLRLGMAIAHDRHYEVECLQVIVVSRDRPPAETPIRTTRSRRLLKHAMRLGKAWRIPVHTRICVSHDLAQGILETAREGHIDLILMGWKGGTSTPGRVFGNVVDTLIQQATCDVVLVKLGDRTELTQPFTDPRYLITTLPLAETQSEQEVENGSTEKPPIPALPHFDRWLIPIGGGPNVQQAIQLLPSLVALSQTPKVVLCQVYQPSQPNPDLVVLEQATHFLQERLHSPVISTPLCSHSVPEAIVDLAEKDQCDVILMGASREGLLQQAIYGNIPEEIARRSHCTVILVRRSLQNT